MDKIQIPDIQAMLEEKRNVEKRPASPLHEFVNKARLELEETSKKGDGSYGFYLGHLKKIPMSELYSMLHTAKQANTPLNAFWKMVGEYKKNLKK